MNVKSEYKVTKFRLLYYNFAAGVIFLAGYLIILRCILQNPQGLLAESVLEHNNIIALFAFIGFISVIHELLHGLTYKMFGARVKYGVKLLNLYTMDVSGKYFSTNQMLSVLLAPLTVITLLLMVFCTIYSQYLYYILVGMLFNLSGSVGDIAMSLYILFNGKECKVRDDANGFSLHSPTLKACKSKTA